MASPYKITIDLDIRDEGALKAMIADLQRLAGAAPKAQQATRNLNKGLRQTQIHARTSGRAVQNASYQIQDMIVQISGGVDPLRSFSQQLPQLFINAGKVGAALGLIAAALPLVIQAFTKTEIGAGNLNKRLETLNNELDEFAKLSKTLDMQGWIKSFNELDAVGKQLAATLLDVRIQAKELQLESMIAEWSAFGNVLSGNMGEIQLNSMANNLGITVGHMEELVSLVNSVNGNILGNPEVLSRMIDILGDGGESARVMLEQLEALRATQASLGTARGVAGQAAGGGRIATAKDAAAAAREYAKELAEIAKAYAALYPNQVKFFEQVKLANTMLEAGLITLEEYQSLTNAYSKALDPEETARIQRGFEEAVSMGRDGSNNQLVEQFSLATEAVDIFQSTFDSAVDGIARGTQDISDAFESMAKSIIVQMAKLAAQQGIGMLLSGSSNSFLAGVGGALLPTASAKGNAFSGGNVIPFAKGGVVSGPTLFPMANGAGLMGEAGPEAVMPLGRNSRGELGIKGGGMNVTVNNNAAGVSVTPRQTDDGLTIDIMMEQVANEVRRGGNRVSDAFEQTYSVNRGRGVY